MIEFTHSDTGSIRCPLHNQRETFMAGFIIQPLDSALVRYPCGYVDGLPEKMGDEPFVPVQQTDEALKELSNRLRRLEERPYSRPVVPKMESRPTESTTPIEPSLLERYANPNK